MKKLWLHIEMPDRSVWAVPAEVIAKNRAAFYAERETGETSSPEYQAEFNGELTFALSEAGHYALTDWAVGDMNWEDVAEHAKQAKPAPAVDLEEGWMGGSKWVAEWDGDADADD